MAMYSSKHADQTATVGACRGVLTPDGTSNITTTDVNSVCTCARVSTGRHADRPVWYVRQLVASSSGSFEPNL